MKKLYRIVKKGNHYKIQGSDWLWGWSDYGDNYSPEVFITTWYPSQEEAEDFIEKRIDKLNQAKEKEEIVKIYTK